MEIVQGSQIVHIDEFCNECGNCSTFCVHEGRPFMDKPRLCLDEESFASLEDNAFRVEEKRIRRKTNGVEESLTVLERGYLYENADLRVEMDEGYVVRASEAKRPFEGVASLRSAVEMSVLHRGLSASMSWLLDDRAD